MSQECVEIDSSRQKCFLTKLEDDLQRVFDFIHATYHIQKSISVHGLLKKGSIFSKGDFLLYLGSDNDYILGSAKKELFHELSKISYIRECDIDDNDNLILCLNRPILFRSILKNALKSEKKFGMKATDRSYLILVHNEVFKHFDSLRIALIADYLISFLAANGAKVTVNEYRKDIELAYKQAPTLACTDQCLEQIQSISEIIRNAVREYEWTSVSDDDSLVVDLKTYGHYSSLGPFKEDINNLIIEKNSPNIVVNQGAYTVHFLNYHITESPDIIIHVCSDSQKRKIIDSSLLIDMLHLVSIPQYFISCQTTVSKIESEITIEKFMKFQKKEIEVAMTHKLHSSTIVKEILDNYLRTLIDTAVKFYFFRAGTNVPLKLNMTYEKDGIFIQYNFARLSNLLKNFQIKVEEGMYQNLPELDEIDFQLLKFEEEWNLLGFVLHFPRLVEEIFCSIHSKQVFEVSKVYIMLTKLCHCFSKYYSRIHILGGPQPQLQSVMHARLWLLKGVHQVMHNSFSLLNIEGLNKM